MSEKKTDREILSEVREALLDLQAFTAPVKPEAFINATDIHSKILHILALIPDDDEEFYHNLAKLLYQTFNVGNADHGFNNETVELKMTYIATAKQFVAELRRLGMIAKAEEAEK